MSCTILDHLNNYTFRSTCYISIMIRMQKVFIRGEIIKWSSIVHVGIHSTYSLRAKSRDANDF